LCDVDSAKFESYAQDGRGPRRWIDAREGRFLAREEKRLAQRADKILLVSEAEADLFRKRTGLPPARVKAVGNGIDTDVFDPARIARHGVLEATPGPHIVFTGQMDYPPNVAAVRRTTEVLMPSIRAVYRDATFHIVGRAPAPDVAALDGLNGTRVWGEVPDVRPFLAAADLVMAPLAIARGVQNKVLEAMAMGRPVVLTTGAATGIGASDGRDYLVADSDEELIEAAVRLLGDRAAASSIGASARRFVIEHKEWASALAELSEIVGKAPPARHAA
jgi:sugar transferase (PEP-CTERM/EpsH1 system associated)